VRRHQVDVVVQAGAVAPADRHEVRHGDAPGGGRDLGAEDVGAVEVAALDARRRRGGHAPVAAAVGVEQPAEHGLGVVPLEAAPVDAAVARDERRAVAVADGGVVADRPVARPARLRVRRAGGHRRLW
jgi:hypothetical protein